MVNPHLLIFKNLLKILLLFLILILLLYIKRILLFLSSYILLFASNSFINITKALYYYNYLYKSSSRQYILNKLLFYLYTKIKLNLL